MSGSSLVEITGLAKRYGQAVALEGVSLRVAEGERLVLVGRNGSGKTTLLRIIAGLLDATEGEVSIEGDRPGSMEARRRVSYLPDAPVLYDDLSVWEHLEYVARLHDVTNWEEVADDLLDRLGLTKRADHLPSTFSRGLRQKASVALGFVRPFDILLVDEPFVGLDPPGKEAVIQLVRDRAADGATTIVATHQLEYLAEAERALVLHDGSLVYEGDPSRDRIEPWFS